MLSEVKLLSRYLNAVILESENINESPVKIQQQRLEEVKLESTSKLYSPKKTVDGEYFYFIYTVGFTCNIILFEWIFFRHQCVQINNENSLE